MVTIKGGGELLLHVAAIMLNMPCRVSGDNLLLALFTKIHLQFVSPLERGEHGIPQRVSPRGKGTFSARYGRASFEVRAEKSNYTIARRPFAEGNSLRGTGQNVEGALDQVGPYVA